MRTVTALENVKNAQMTAAVTKAPACLLTPVQFLFKGMLIWSFDTETERLFDYVQTTATAEESAGGQWDCATTANVEESATKFTQKTVVAKIAAQL